MASLLLRRRRNFVLQALILRIAKQQTVVAAAGFATIDGEMIPYSAGAAAIRNGTAVLVGGLLVGAVPSHEIN
jgi:hypothetical protein